MGYSTLYAPFPWRVNGHARGRPSPGCQPLSSPLHHTTLHYSHLSTFPIQTHASGRLEACVRAWVCRQPPRRATPRTHLQPRHFHFVLRPLNVTYYKGPCAAPPLLCILFIRSLKCLDNTAPTWICQTSIISTLNNKKYVKSRPPLTKNSSLPQI